jgi:cation diffusion facilitator CzcD-associated flavoprotein CzcO
VAVVGSGASAIQFVPRIVAHAEAVTIFQRSCNYVAPKSDRVYGSSQRWLLDHVRAYEVAYRWWIYWTLEARWLAFRKGSLAGRTLERMFTTQVRDKVVGDRLPVESVVPDYSIGCKRIPISNDWYPAILQKSVEVVNESIDHVESDALVTTDGRRHLADLLIFGTGFHTTDFLAHIPITGRDGLKLAETWENGARAYRGITVSGFPNCFLLYGPTTNLGHNSILFMVERQMNLILQALALQTQGTAQGARGSVEVTRQASDRDDARTQRLMARTVWVSSCRSWYKTASGRVTNNWPSWTFRYWIDTLRLRKGDLVPDPPDANQFPSRRP